MSMVNNDIDKIVRDDRTGDLRLCYFLLTEIDVCIFVCFGIFCFILFMSCIEIPFLMWLNVNKPRVK